MARTILPREALANSAAVANSAALADGAPIEPDSQEAILGENPETPATQPGSQPSSQPTGPANPDPPVLLIHRSSIVTGPGTRLEADGPVFARDPLGGAARLLWNSPADAANELSAYHTIGRLVFLMRFDHVNLPLYPSMLNRYRMDFASHSMPVVTERIEFEAPPVTSERDLESLAELTKFFGAPRFRVWNYAHGGEVLTFYLSAGIKEALIEKRIKKHKRYLLDGTPSPAAIASLPKSTVVFEIGAEWFQTDAGSLTPPIPDDQLPKRGAVLRSAGKVVKCPEGDYSKVDFNENGPLQLIEVELDPAIPLKPV